MKTSLESELRSALHSYFREFISSGESKIILRESSTLELLELYDFLESKDHLIKKLSNLSPEEKSKLIDFFKKNPSLESKIDWNRKDLVFNDFESLFSIETKTRQQKNLKAKGLEALKKGIDYGVAFEDENYIALVPFTHAVSKAIASSRIGSCVGKWCTATQKRGYWMKYTSMGIMLIYIIDKTNPPSFGKIAIASSSERGLEIFNAEDKPMSREDLKGFIPNYPEIVAAAEKFNDKIVVVTPRTLTYRILKDAVAPGEINKNSDGSYDIIGDVYLIDKDLTSLGNLKIRSVTGYFDCSENMLTSLMGSPLKVGGTFRCSYNQLTTLEGGPRDVGGDYFCSVNKLISLKGAPQTVLGKFEGSFNQLTSLEGAPMKVGKTFWCVSNPGLTKLGIPEDFAGEDLSKYIKFT